MSKEGMSPAARAWMNRATALSDEALPGEAPINPAVTILLSDTFLAIAAELGAGNNEIFTALTLNFVTCGAAILDDRMKAN